MKKLRQGARKQRPGIKTVLIPEMLTKMFLESAISTLSHLGLMPLSSEESKYPGLRGVVWNTVCTSDNHFTDRAWAGSGVQTQILVLCPLSSQERPFPPWAYSAYDSLSYPAAMRLGHAFCRPRVVSGSTPACDGKATWCPISPVQIGQSTCLV